MATLTVQESSIDGITPTFNACDVAGDEFVNDGDIWIHIDNSDASPHTATIDTPQTVDGLALSNPAVVVAAGTQAVAGPFSTTRFNDAAGKVQITYDAVTSLTIAVIRLAR